MSACGSPPHRVGGGVGAPAAVSVSWGPGEMEKIRQGADVGGDVTHFIAGSGPNRAPHAVFISMEARMRLPHK